MKIRSRCRMAYRASIFMIIGKIYSNKFYLPPILFVMTLLFSIFDVSRIEAMTSEAGLNPGELNVGASGFVSYSLPLSAVPSGGKSPQLF